MDSLQASSHSPENLNAPKPEETASGKLEELITPEQVLSASVARKRRTLTKKQNRTREQTPVRDKEKETTSEEEACERTRPKTPERRRRKSTKLPSTEREESPKVSRDFQGENRNEPSPTPPTVSSRESIPRQIEEKKKKKELSDQKRKDSLVEITQAEVMALFSKAKRGLASGRDRIREIKSKKSASKRSQSVPSQFTESELMESLRKANLINGNYEDVTSLHLSMYEEQHKPKQYRPVVQQYVAKRKRQRLSSSFASPKVIEVLDPKTCRVIKKIRKGPPEPSIKPLHVLLIFKYYSLWEIYRQYRQFKIEHREECVRIARLRNRCVCDATLLIIFCGLGSMLFKNIEGAFENFYKCGVKRVKRDFVDLLWHRSHNLREEDWKSLARSKLRSFEEELHTAHEAGMRSYSGSRSWSFLNGLIYCFQVISTIGYGNIYPTTNTGRALTIVYAIIGIPLFLIALTDFGKFFTRCIKFLWSFVRRVYYTGSCRKVRKTTHMQDIFQGAQVMYEFATLRRPSMFANVDPENLQDDPENPKTTDGHPLDSALVGTDTPTTPAPSNFEIDDEFNLPISVAIFILVLYILLGAVMYCILEDEWKFFDSFYFVFVSMSTVGFGDIVPVKTISMVASIVYLVFGLALMSMCINVVQVKLSDTFKDASSKLGATIGISVDEDDGSITTVSPAPVEIAEIHGDTDQANTEKQEECKNGLEKREKVV